MTKTGGSLGLIGFGAFGRLIARHLSDRFEILACDPAAIDDMGVVSLTDLATAAACPIVILAVPVEAMQATVAAIAPHVLSDAVVIDVGSVKVLPARLMAEGLPRGVRIVGCHPLFGPQSGKDGIEGLRIAVCPINDDPTARRVAAFCRAVLGLKVFLVSPEDHDREAAVVQGLTHLIARVLLAMEPLPTRMTTASFERIMQAVEMVATTARRCSGPSNATTPSPQRSARGSSPWRIRPGQSWTGLPGSSAPR
jgi:prephenate dehydrogenase